MHPTVKHVCYTLVVLALFAGSAQGGILASEADLGKTAAIAGTESFSGNNFFAQTLIADVDYAVYAPGDFGLSVALGLPVLDDPSGDTEWVYAYQIDNDVGGQLRVAALSIELNPGVISNLANVSHTATTPAGGLDPNAFDFIPIAINPPSNVKWSYTVSANLLNVGLQSDILLFTSPFGPTFLHAAMTGGSASNAPLAGDENFLPSPIPEPSTLVLSALAAALLAAGYLRRHRV